MGSSSIDNDELAREGSDKDHTPPGPSPSPAPFGPSRAPSEPPLQRGGNQFDDSTMAVLQVLTKNMGGTDVGFTMQEQEAAEPASLNLPVPLTPQLDYSLHPDTPTPSVMNDNHTVRFL